VGLKGGATSTCCVICFPRHMQEEREVLCSIYESDEYFKEHSPTSFTYRVYTVLQVPCDLTSCIIHTLATRFWVTAVTSNLMGKSSLYKTEWFFRWLLSVSSWAANRLEVASVQLLAIFNLTNQVIR